MPVRTIAAIVSGLILVNMPFMPSSSPPSSSGRIEIGTRAAVAPSGGEVIGLLTTAIHARIPVSTLLEMHYAYPTFHRVILEALADV